MYIVATRNLCTHNYIGNRFYIGFLPNFGTPPLIAIFNYGEELTKYSVEAPVTGFYRNGTITANAQIVINLPNSLVGPSYNFDDVSDDVNNAYKEGIYLQTNKNRVAVIGSYNHPKGLIDTFFAIPTVDLCLTEYMYFAVSVSTNVNADGSVVIVGTANQTVVNITVPVSAVIKINNSVDWSSLDPGILYSYVIQRLQIVYIAAYTTDLTGTRVTTNKPVSLFSGHECASSPCDHLAEQIPPTELWGTVYYFTPIVNRISYVIKIIAAYNSTNVNIYCNGTSTSYYINAGGSISVTYYNQEFCGVYADKKVLVVQYSLSNSQVRDSLMTLIPATSHYTDSITSTTIQTPMESNDDYINIVVLPDYYQPTMISLTTAGGISQSLDSLSWVPIVRNGVTEAYTAQVNIPHGIFEVTHVNSSALMTVVVNGVSYGHPGFLRSHTNST